ncbi:VapC toxin family PIN domain ribonuclease [Allosaccharopolyspora coralli]|uniref:VapC toxin family PIN domain ribonuclease n=1 Tax=Allosaccharopolyspora coralli TaxID=2665642 RepID=A0A5Q3Q840_9PSEU|nr:type II toxin-antitoxin system VapC family toxin [Allosaccharopolyspora coralli]QGK69980.1 VapC toxin family PIN domain ribonuclease [Allosaccharopolyspora coralli]
MILVDTSIWIDHFRSGDAELSRLLDNNAILGHPWVTGEIGLGNLRHRDEVIGLLRGLPRASVADEDEVLKLIDREALYGAGIGYVDAQLLAASRLTPDARLWTRDKRLLNVTARMELDFQPSSHQLSDPETH